MSGYCAPHHVGRLELHGTRPDQQRGVHAFADLPPGLCAVVEPFSSVTIALSGERRCHGLKESCTPGPSMSQANSSLGWDSDATLD